MRHTWSRLTGTFAAAALAVAGIITTAGPASAESVPVANLLATLHVSFDLTATYDRNRFEHWIDADRDGCDTRAEVLQVESRVPVGGGCPVRTGQWLSYVDGAFWTNASDVDVDHTVPLAEAWRSGAAEWNDEQRKAYANDLVWAPTLIAITDNVNQSKGDKDPAQWLPPASVATCQYIADWVSVKYRWHLDLDAAEKAKLSDLLATTCAGATTTVPPVADVPETTTAVQSYVSKVYQDLFHRTPDPTGLTNWTASLRGGQPYSSVANSITASDEYRSRMIVATYNRYLGRGAEPSGLAFWLKQMANGRHIEQVQAGFISSDEFFLQQGGTSAGWVTGLYRTVLNRDPAQSEVDYWVQKQQAGMDRASVALGFLYSTEHLTTVVDGYYHDLLGRGIDPTGRDTWVGQLQSGHRDEEIIGSIIASQEYRAKA